MELISRQAAIDAIDELKIRYFDRKVILAKAQDALNNLPSAQPETCVYWDRESNICALHRPSAQSERMKGEEMTIAEAKRMLTRIKDRINFEVTDSQPKMDALNMAIKALSAQPERTEYFSDTKAIPSQSDCVCLSDKVTATFFDAEHEEWTQQTVTIADVLDSVCDDYTVLPPAEPERKGKWIDAWRSRWDGTKHWYRECNQCGYERDDDNPDKDTNFCPNCGARMVKGEDDED